VVDPIWQSEVKVERLRYIWPNSWSALGHARSLSSDTRLKWHAFPLVVLFSLVAILRLWQTVVRERLDIIHAHWLVPGGFIGAVVSRLTGIPLVLSLHGSDVFVAEHYKILRPAIQFVLGTACHVIACSSDLAQRTIKFGLSSKCITVIPYGVDTERYFPDFRAAQKLRTQLSIPDSQNIVMVMGRLVYKKGFSYFLRAAPLVLNRFPNTRLIVVGEGDLRAELEALTKSMLIQKHVLFTGRVPWDQTPAYQAMADVFVVPSVQDESGNVDGLPNVLLESMASGCAIVASRVAGIPEIVRHGENGLLTPPKDELALAEAICVLLADRSLRERLGNAARLTVANELNWMHIGARVAAILQTCIRKRIESKSCLHYRD